MPVVVPIPVPAGRNLEPAARLPLPVVGAEAPVVELVVEVAVEPVAGGVAVMVVVEPVAGGVAVMVVVEPVAGGVAVVAAGPVELPPKVSAEAGVEVVCPEEASLFWGASPADPAEGSALLESGVALEAAIVFLWPACPPEQLIESNKTMVHRGELKGKAMLMSTYFLSESKL